MLVTVGVIPPLAQNTIMGREIRKGIWNGHPVEYVAGQIVLRLNEGIKQENILPLLEKMGGRVVRGVDKNRIGLVEFDPQTDIFPLLGELNSSSAIEWAEPNGVSHACLSPNDPYYDPIQWGLNNYSQWPPGGTYDCDIDAPEAWDVTTGSSSIWVGVLDSGIPMQYYGVLSHPDLDDIYRFVPGTDWVNDGYWVMDEFGHGTHVLGIIGAETNNNEGVAGVNWRCQFLVDQVFDKWGQGSVEDFYEGVVNCVDNGCKIINYSGGTPTYYYTLLAAVEYAKDWALIIASAGNDNSAGIYYPARFAADHDNVIAVGAIDPWCYKAPYSNYDNGEGALTLCAPGGGGLPFDSDDIYSTTPNYDFTLEFSGCTEWYSYMAGTSMATAFVSGVAALCLSVEPSLSPCELKNRLQLTCDDITLYGEGWDVYTGYGCVNAKKALDEGGPAVPTKYFYAHGGYQCDSLFWGVEQLGWEKFYIHRSDCQDGPFALVDSVPEEGYDYVWVDYNLSWSTPYFYCLSVPADPELTFPVSATPTGLPTPEYPPTPYNLKAQDHPGDQGGAIDLSWSSSDSTNPKDAPPQHPLVYHVYRSERAGGIYPYQYLGVSTGTTFTDWQASPNVTYYYVVRSWSEDDGLHSKRSNEASASSEADPRFKQKESMAR